MLNHKTTKTKLLLQIIKLEKQLQVYKLLFGEFDFDSYNAFEVFEIGTSLKPYRDKVLNEFKK